MELTFNQDWSRGGRTYRSGQTTDVPDNLAELAVAEGAAAQPKRTATKKTKTRKAVTDADSDVHQPADEPTGD